MLNFIILYDDPGLSPWLADTVAAVAASGNGRCIGAVRCDFTTGREPENDKARSTASDERPGHNSEVVASPIEQLAGDYAREDGIVIDFILDARHHGAALDLPAKVPPGRMGTWRFEVDGRAVGNADAAILDRIMERAATIPCALTATGVSRQVLHQGTFSIIPQSAQKTLLQITNGWVPWLNRVCADIVLNGRTQFPSCGLQHVPAREQKRNPRGPRALFAQFANRLRAQWRYRFFRQQWNVGVIDAPIAVVAGLEGSDAQARALARTRWMPERPHKFYADPFGYRDTHGRCQVLMEELDWRVQVGEIVRVTVGNDFSAPLSVLKAGTHLSYPFIVREGSHIRFIPEHASARDVSAFLLDDHGRASKKETLVKHMELLDCTFHEQDGKVWMFACVDGHASNTDLHIYHAESFNGPWFPHALNPVKTDVTSARPAGGLFAHDGELYRPGQDCSTHYGRAVSINRVLRLSETDYAEVEVERVQPVDALYSDGLHTISALDDMTLIDGARLQAIWSRGTPRKAPIKPSG